MRIVIVTNGDPLAWLSSHKLFQDNENWEVVGVVYIRIPFSARIHLLRSAIANRSVYYAAFMQLEIVSSYFFIKQQASGKLSKKSIQQAADSCGIPSLTTDDINCTATLNYIATLKPDLIASIRPGQIFKRPAIDALPEIWNIHCSRLPWHAGIGGVLQALSAGDEQLGVTVHIIESEQIDSGPIVCQQLTPNHQNHSVLASTIRLYLKAADVITNALQKRRKGKQELLDNVGGSHNSWPGTKPLRSLHARGRVMFRLKEVFGYFNSM